jgi:protein transport protein SEC61 subunit gamma and related proteins
MKAKELLTKTKSFIKECRRVLQITKKPSMEEFKAIVKITGLGMLLIGAVGFIITVTGLLVGIGI